MFLPAFPLLGIKLHRLGRQCGSLEKIRAQPVHLRAHVMNLDQLFRREQSHTHHPAVNQCRPLVAGRGNQVASSEPRAAPERTQTARGFFDVRARKWRELARIQIEFARGLLLSLWSSCASSRFARLQIFDNLSEPLFRRLLSRPEQSSKP